MGDRGGKHVVHQCLRSDRSRVHVLNGELAIRQLVVNFPRILLFVTILRKKTCN